MHAAACGHCFISDEYRYHMLRNMVTQPAVALSQYQSWYRGFRLPRWWGNNRNTTSADSLFSGISAEEVNSAAKDLLEHISHADAEIGVAPSAITAHIPQELVLEVTANKVCLYIVMFFIYLINIFQIVGG